MGILFNVLFIYPLRRLFAGMNANWQARKDAGEKVFPLKPDSVFLLVIATPMLFLVVGAALNALIRSIF